MTYEIVSVRKRKTVKIRTPIDIYNAVRRYTTNKQEVFLVLTLNGEHEIIAIHIATIGLVNETKIHPREVFKHAYIDNAVAVVIAHNHPSGCLFPTIEDIEVTERMIGVSEVMGIHVMDHLIITAKYYYSFKENGNI